MTPSLKFESQGQEIQIPLKEVEYLGYIISDKEVSSQKNKIDAILQLSPPTNHKELQGFLRMVNYYQRLYSTSKINIKPSTYLTSTKVKFKWTKEAKNSFDSIKELLLHDTLLLLH